RGKLDDAQHQLEALAQSATAFRAKALLARLLVMRGHRAQAQPTLDALMDAAETEINEAHPRAEVIFAAAIAARTARQYSFADDACQQANDASPHDVELQLEWADLFLEKNDAGHAEECVRDALGVNGKSPRVHALAARVALAQGFDFAKARTECD